MKFCWLLGIFLLCAVLQLSGQNTELKKLMEEDQAARQSEKMPPGGYGDEPRIQRVLELLAKGQVQTPEDKFNAALILQHTPLKFCEGKLVAESPYNFLLAHYLARESYEGGYQDARTLVAAALDRYLSFTEGRQKYGTNRVYNQKTGKEEWVPIDRNVPDSERAKYGVAPLAKLLEEYPEQKPHAPGKTHK